MPKQVLMGDEARAALLRGIEFLAGPVVATLGPGGRLAVTSRRAIGQSPAVTKDGVSVANQCDPACPFEQLGSDLCREAAQRTVENAGDGTTSTVVLTRAMVRAGLEQLKAGHSPAELCRGINKAVSAVVAALEKMAIPADSERLAQVATISANGDETIGELVRKAIDRVGKDGVMTCEESRSLDTTLDVVDGLQMRQGFRSPYFMNNPERQACEFEDCLILLHEGKLGAGKSLVNLIKLVRGIGRPLLLIAGDYEPESLSVLVLNKVQAGIPLCAIRADAWGDRRREILRDIAVLTGGKAITEDLGMKIENVTEDYFGKAKRVTVTEYRTTITEGAGDPEAIKIRADEIRSQMPGVENPQLLQQRLSGLTGGVAVIRVGGATEQEMKERKDRVEDALFAAKAAAEGGYVVGGGLALAQIGGANSLHYSIMKTPVSAIGKFNPGEVFRVEGYQRLEPIEGIDGAEGIVWNACRSPLMQIAANAGVACQFSDNGWGMNAATGKNENFLETGVIDPMPVVRESLVNAASVACVVLRSESLIVDLPESSK